jgi:hypothetical protein
MFEQQRLGDNGTSAATSKQSGDRGDEVDEQDGQVAHLAIVPFSTSVTRLGTRWDLCDKSGISHRQAESALLNHHARAVAGQKIPLPQQVRNRLARNMQSMGVRSQERVTDQSPS